MRDRRIAAFAFSDGRKAR